MPTGQKIYCRNLLKKYKTGYTMVLASILSCSTPLTNRRMNLKYYVYHLPNSFLPTKTPSVKLPLTSLPLPQATPLTPQLTTPQ